MRLTDITPESITETERMALAFLAKGPDCIGVIDTDEKLAAALVFETLRRRGLVVSTITDDGPEYRITRDGLAALKGGGE